MKKLVKKISERSLTIVLSCALILSSLALMPASESEAKTPDNRDPFEIGDNELGQVNEDPYLVISEVCIDSRGKRGTEESVSKGRTAYDQFDFIELYNPNDYPVSLNNVGLYYADSTAWGVTPIWDAEFTEKGGTTTGKDGTGAVLEHLTLTTKSIPAHSYFIVWSIFTKEWTMDAQQHSEWANAANCFTWTDFKEYFENDEKVVEAISEGRMGVMFKPTEAALKTDAFLPSHGEVPEGTVVDDDGNGLTAIDMKGYYLSRQIEDAGYTNLRVVGRGEVLKSMNLSYREGGGYFFNMRNTLGGTYYVGDLSQFSAEVTEGAEEVATFGQYWSSFKPTKSFASATTDWARCEIGQINASNEAADKVSLVAAGKFTEPSPGYGNEEATIIFEKVPEGSKIQVYSQNKTYEAGADKTVTLKLPVGKHDYRVYVDGQHTVNRVIEVGYDELVRTQTTFDLTMIEECPFYVKACTKAIIEEYRPDADNMNAPTYTEINKKLSLTGTDAISEGYLFAGWFTEESCEWEARVRENNFTYEDITYYARFVPKHELSTKAQVTAGLKSSDTKGAIRFVTSVDNLEYLNIGFDWAIEGVGSGTKKDHNVYSNLYYVGEVGTGDGTTEPRTLDYVPKYTYCTESSYFKTWTMKNVPKNYFNTDFIVTPFWTTLDGTKVCGDEVTRTIQECIDGAEARIGETVYMHIEEAFAAAPTDGVKNREVTTIEILKDVALTETLTMQEGQNILLTDNGATRTLSRGETANGTFAGRFIQVPNNATLNIKGSFGDAKESIILDGTVPEAEKATFAASKSSQLLAVGNAMSNKDAVSEINGGVYFKNNVSNYGPAVLNYGHLTINGGIFRGNYSGGNAGAIGIQSGSVVINDADIRDNIAVVHGGAIQVQSSGTADSHGNSNTDNPANLTVKGGTIVNNTAQDSAGAIRADNTTTVIGGTITGNVCTNEERFRTGGIFVGCENVTLGSAATDDQNKALIVDRIWIAEHVTDVDIASANQLAKADDVSICIAQSSGYYGEGRRLLAGDASVIASVYQKFYLPDVASAGAGYTIDSTGSETYTMIKLSVNGKADAFYTDMADAVAAIPAGTATSSAKATITLLGNITLTAPVVVGQYQELTITDDGAPRRIKRGTSFTNGRMFATTAGTAGAVTSKLTFDPSGDGDDKNPTLIIDGNSVVCADNTSSAVYVNAYSEFIMEAGTWIWNNLAWDHPAVEIYNGTFRMKGGEIKNNETVEYTKSEQTQRHGVGGAVDIRGVNGYMEMSGGTISANRAANGAGVNLAATRRQEGSGYGFVMTGGEITRNRADTVGGGLRIQSRVKLTGGSIHGNTGTNHQMSGDVYVTGSNELKSGDYDCVHLEIGGGIKLEKVWLQLASKGARVKLLSELTRARQDTITIGANGYYSVDKQVLISDNTTLLEQCYNVFLLPEKRMKDNNIAIGSDGKIITEQYSAAGE